MLLILALLYFSRSAIHAAPVSAFSGDLSSGDPLSSSAQCVCPNQQRTIWDIIWSCLATIFACTWVSVHPNIPAPGEKWWKIWLRRLEVMFWAIIAPELMISWAMRQWLGARKLANRYHAQGWKKTHGYFIQMGGFTLYKGNDPQGVLSPKKMEELLEKGEIEFPTITEEEIKDRSKGDGLSKALVVGQTTWFVMQCIARRAQGLNITELELITSAFAVLNGFIFFLWWNKPLDVRCSVPVRLLDEEKRKKFEPTAELEASKTKVALWVTAFSTVRTIYEASSKPFAHIPKVVKTKGVVGILKAFLMSPWIAIQAFFSKLVEFFDDDDEFKEGEAQVPKFYADTMPIKVGYEMITFMSIVAVIFGAIHCAGWFFLFPSRPELILWRVCSTVITGIPLLFTIWGAIGPSVHDDIDGMSGATTILAFIFYLAPLGASIVVLPFYMIARLLLLAEAFVALRDLPLGAYDVVQWVTFIPHI